MAHGETEQGAAIAGAVLPAIQGLDEERRRFYLDLVISSLHEAARRTLEAKMKGHEYQGDFAKTYVAEGEARALLTWLRSRGIDVPEAARERILAEKAPERVMSWIERAVTATTLAQVLDDPS